MSSCVLPSHSGNADEPPTSRVDAVERQRETQSNHSSNPELAATVQGEQAASAEADVTQQHAAGPGNQGFSPEQEVTAQEVLTT